VASPEHPEQRPTCRQTVWGLITRQAWPKQLLGPVAIAQLSGEQAQLGWIPLLSLLASINLNLGLLNLLPSLSSPVRRSRSG
jgi:membrane-associated protease RseP (regulator of RpoE activity)